MRTIPPGMNHNPLEHERLSTLIPYIKNLVSLGRLPPLAGKKVLDVGSGNGFGVRVFASLGADAVGIEIEPKRAVQARESGCDVVCADAADAAQHFGNASIDVVCIFLAPLYDVRFCPAMKNALSVLKKVGYVLVTVPSPPEMELAQSVLQNAGVDGAFEWHPELLCDKYVYAGRLRA